jgi:hypothetical protein
MLLLHFYPAFHDNSVLSISDCDEGECKLRLTVFGRNQVPRMFHEEDLPDEDISGIEAEIEYLIDMGMNEGKLGGIDGIGIKGEYCGPTGDVVQINLWSPEKGSAARALFARLLSLVDCQSNDSLAVYCDEVMAYFGDG